MDPRVSSAPSYELDPKGHEWRKNDDGTVDVFGLDDDIGFHNGPICVKCYYSFCEHCNRGPIEECPGVLEEPSHDRVD